MWCTGGAIAGLVNGKTRPQTHAFGHTEAQDAAIVVRGTGGPPGSALKFAELTVQVAIEVFGQRSRPGGAPGDLVFEALEAAHERLRALPEAEDGAGSEAAAAVVRGDKAAFGWVGGCGGYLFRGGELLQQTGADDTALPCCMPGRDGAGAAHPHHPLRRRLGHDSESGVEVGHTTFSSGDVLLLWTDLLDVLTPERVAAALGAGGEWPHRVQRVLAAAAAEKVRSNVAIVAMGGLVYAG